VKESTNEWEGKSFMTQQRKQPRFLVLTLLLALLLAACSSGDGTDEALEPAVQQDPTSESEGTALEPAAESPTPEPSETPLPPTEEPEATDEPPEPTLEPADTPTPEPTAALSELIPIGSVADLTSSDDIAGIEGVVEVISVNQVRIREFVSLVSAAPGVDIRLGFNRDFSDEVAAVLKDITGDDYEGRSLTLTIPDSAYDGRSFNSISVFCWETGEIFDWATFDLPQSG
jgi:hypothetical protein